MIIVLIILILLMTRLFTKKVIIIVAHPDDETLWAGGTILSHPSWKCFVVCLCRRSDSERAQKFHKALKALKSGGVMGDLDDGPEQRPLGENEVEETIMSLLPGISFDLIMTHCPTGEYTRHLRHEEVSKAVINLWNAGKIPGRELWAFAYEDGNRDYYPRPVDKNTIYRVLTPRIWNRKYKIVTETYGYKKGSFEAETVPKAEAFWQFTDPYNAKKWLRSFTD